MAVKTVFTCDICNDTLTQTGCWGAPSSEWRTYLLQEEGCPAPALLVVLACPKHSLRDVLRYIGTLKTT